MADTKITLLVAEEDDNHFQKIQQLMPDNREISFKIYHGADYQQCLELLQDHCFDLCLINYHYAGKTADQLLPCLSLHAACPFIVYSEVGDSREKYISLNNGAVDYISTAHLTEETLRQALLYARSTDSTDLLPHKLFLDNLSETYSINDSKGNFLYFHKGEKSIISQSIPEICNMNVREFLPATIADKLISDFKKTIAEKIARTAEFPIFYENRQVIFEARMVPFHLNSGEDAVASLLLDVTARKKAEEETKLQSFLLDTINDSVFMHDINGNFLYANRETCNTLGYSREELLTKNIYDLMYNDLPELNMADLKKYDREMFEEAVRKQSLRFESAFYPRGGKILPVEVNTRIIIHQNKQYLVSMMRDLTEKKYEQEKFRALVENSRNLIMRFDREYRHLYVNPVSLKMLGIAPETFIGKTHQELGFPAKMNNYWDNLIQQVFDEKKSNIVDFMIKVNGQPLYLDWHLNPEFDINGNVISVMTSAHDITSLKTGEKYLKESENKYRALVENSQDIIMRVGRDHRHLYVNSAISQINMKPADFLGKTHREMNFPEEMCQFFERNTELVFTSGKSHTAQFSLPLAGKEIYFDWQLTPEFNAQGEVITVLSTSRDITTQKNTEKALEYREELDWILLSLATKFINLPVTEIDEGINSTLKKVACFLNVNRSYVMKYNHDITFFDCTHEWCPPGVNSIMGKMQNQPSSICGAWLQKFKEGRFVYVPQTSTYSFESAPLKKMIVKFKIKTLIIFPIHANGTLLGVLAFDSIREEKNWSTTEIQMCQLLSKLYANIFQRRETQQELISAKETAEEASRAKSAFLANMSHEIRTPMNAVIGFSELLAKISRDEKQMMYINNIKSGGKALLTLINDILDLSKIEAGKMEIKKHHFHPSHLFQEIAEIFRIKTEKKGVDLIVKIDETLPPEIMADETRIRQIMLNIISNAVKFTEEGYIKFTVTKENSRKGDEFIDLLVTVEDSGIGIPPSSHELIFNSFKQQEEHNTRKFGGTGLGLAITKQLVEMMNGQISLTSEEGKGSCFQVHFRDIEIARKQPLADEKLPESPPSGDLIFEKATILIADDIEFNREVLKELFCELQLDTRIAVNGREAYLLARKIKPQLILMDIRMPVMDGYESVRKIKEDPQLASIPVIALTAMALSDEVEKIKQSKFDDFLSKPVEFPLLISKLTHYLKHKIRYPETERDELADSGSRRKQIR